MKHSLLSNRCQIRYRYDLYGNRHLGEGRLLHFSVPLEQEQSVLQTEHSTTPTKVVALLRRSTKTVIRWDSDKQQYTAQRPFLPVTQRITVSRTFGSNRQKVADKPNVFNSESRVASDPNALLGQVVERSEPSVHTGNMGATVIQSSRSRA